MRHDREVLRAFVAPNATAEDYAAKRDPQLDAAVAVLKKAT